MAESIGSEDGMYDRSDKYTTLLIEKSDAISRVCYWHHAIRSKEWERVDEGASRCLSKDGAERSLRHWQDIVEDLDVQISLAELAWYDTAGMMSPGPKVPAKKSVAVGTDEPVAKRIKRTVPVPSDEAELAAAADEADRLEGVLAAQYGNADEWIAEAVDADGLADEAYDPRSDAESEFGAMAIEHEVIDLTNM